MKNKSFYVQIILKDVMVDLNISAESLEDALQKAQKLNIKEDILQDDIGWNDGDMEVTGVFQ